LLAIKTPLIKVRGDLIFENIENPYTLFYNSLVLIVNLKMKKILYFMAILVFESFVVSCGLVPEDSSGNDSDSLDLDSIALVELDFKTELKSYEDSLTQNGITAYYCIRGIDVPVSGSMELMSSVVCWLDSVLGHSYEGNLTFDEDMLKHYANRFYDLCDEQEVFDVGPAASYDMTATVLNDTDTYVSYLVSLHEYMGGAHGMPIAYGATFDKEDGSRLGWNLFADTTKLVPLFRNHLSDYFNNDSVTVELEDVLFEDKVNNLPLPVNEPWLENEGVAFIYGAYEIAPYAVGMPGSVIPIKEVKPYLSDRAKKLLNIQ